MQALVVVDVQNDFLSGGRLEVPQGDEIVPLINRLQARFDLVVATQDWHPGDHKSFASNHPKGVPFHKIILNGLEQVLWPDHCVQGTYGAEFSGKLDTGRFAAIFRKGMDPEVDSYSGFYDNGHRINTGLSGYLKEKGVTEAYYCGLASDICVYYTVRDSVREGFSSVLVEDCSRPLSSTDFSAIKTELIQMGVRIINSDKPM